MNNIQKYWEGDIYVLQGITGSTQLKDFYNEVKKANVEKYVAIAQNGKKFIWNEKTEKAEALYQQEYGINPFYIPKAESTMETVEEVVAPVESMVEEKPEVVEEVVQATEPEDNIQEKLAVQIEHNAYLEKENESLRQERLSLKSEIDSLNSEIVKNSDANKAMHELAHHIAEIEALGFEVFVRLKK